MKENIEEDIKNIEEIIELSKEEIDAKDENITAILDIEDLISLQHILSAYKKILKENEKLKNNLSLKQFDINVVYNDYLEKLNEYKKNSISIQKVKDKIEEINKMIVYEHNDAVIIQLGKQKRVLQKLLESEE